MPKPLAILAFAVLILGLFWLDRDRKARTSPALWLPVIWLALAGSRSVSEWLYYAAPAPTEVTALLEGDPLNRGVYTCLVAAALIALAVRGARVLAVLRANSLIVAFLLYCALSLGWADYPDVGFKRWVKAVGDFSMILIVVSDRDPSAAIKRVLTRVGFILIPVAVLMIKYFPDISRYYDVWDWSTYYSGPTMNKNSLGAICLLFGVTSAWQFLAAFNGEDRHGLARRLVAHAVILLMAMWLFKLANSMTALSCFLLGVLILVVLEFRPVVRQPLLAHGLVVSLLAVTSAILFIGLGPDVLLMMGRNPTLTDRTLIWDMLLTMTTNTWLGTGFENFWLGPRLVRIWSVYKWGPTQAHNGFIEIFLNLGWIGIALLTTILLVGYLRIMTDLRRSSPTGNLMLAFFVIGIVYNFTEAAFFRIMTPVWLALLLAIIKVPDRQNLQTQPSIRALPIRVPPVTLDVGGLRPSTRVRGGGRA